MDYTELIKKKLDRLHIDYVDNPLSDWIKCRCINPEHHDTHPSAGINKHSAIFNCFSCGHSEKFITEDDTAGVDEEELLWQMRYSNILTEDAEDIADFTKVNLPPIDYYVSTDWRGISSKLLQELGVYYCSRGRFRGRYIFPIYYRGAPVGFDARIVDDTARAKEAKWLRPKLMPATSIVYRYDQLKEQQVKHVVLTEGIMDAVSYIQMGVPSIPSFGVSPPTIRRIEDLISIGVEDITIAFDNDKAGQLGMVSVLPYYSQWFNIVAHPMVTLVRNSPYKDANEFLEGVKSKGLAKPIIWDPGDEF